MSYVVLACRLVVAGLFAWAAASKLRRQHLRDFAGVLTAARLVPGRVAAPAAATVVAVELLLVGLIFVPSTARAGLTVAAGWTVALTAALLPLRRRSLACRCFGTATPVGVHHLIRNLGIFLTAAGGALGAALTPAGPLQWPAVLVTAIAATTAILAVGLTDQLFTAPSAYRAGAS